RALGNVHAAQPDLRDPKPAVVAVPLIADLNHAGPRLALPRARVSRNDRQIEHSRLAPVVLCRDKDATPRPAYVVTELQGEGIRRARPVIAAPRVGRGCLAWNSGECDGQRRNEYLGGRQFHGFSLSGSKWPAEYSRV